MNELLEILEPVLGDELARDVIAHRKGLKCPLTPRGARSLLKQYELTGRPVEAAEEHLNRGWQGFKAEWMTKPQRYQDERNPTRRSNDMADFAADLMGRYDDRQSVLTRNH